MLHRMYRRVAVVAVVLMLTGCAMSPRGTTAVPTETPSATPSADYSSLPKELPGNGSWVAGESMQPGTWFADPEQTSTCEWFIGKDGKVLASGTGDSVVLEPGETLESSACAVWVLATE